MGMVSSSSSCFSLSLDANDGLLVLWWAEVHIFIGFVSSTMEREAQLAITGDAGNSHYL